MVVKEPDALGVCERGAVTLAVELGEAEEQALGEGVRVVRLLPEALGVPEAVAALLRLPPANVGEAEAHPETDRTLPFTVPLTLGEEDKEPDCEALPDTAKEVVPCA